MEALESELLMELDNEARFLKKKNGFGEILGPKLLAKCCITGVYFFKNNENEPNSLKTNGKNTIYKKNTTLVFLILIIHAAKY